MINFSQICDVAKKQDKMCI